MGLRDELDLTGPGKPCGVGKLLVSLPESVAGELVELMNDLSVKHSQLDRLAKTKGWLGVSAGIIGKHRRKDCGCL